MAELVLQGVSKRFGRKGEIHALEDLSLAVESGELLVLLGPSGSGKTTALRLIGGLEELSAGKIELKGEALDGKAPHERSIAMAFQYPALLPQLDVRGNLALGPKLRKIGAEETAGRIRRASELLGVSDLLARKPETLSGGQQQRVALARALVAEPRLLLLDEPLANLDPLARIELRTAIRRVQRELRLTTIYVTHDQSEAVALGDRIAILDRGRLQQIGSAGEIYRDPVNLFVARFFGPDPVNLLEGKLTIPAAPGGVTRFETRGGPMGIPGRYAVKSESSVTAVIRMGDVELNESASPSTEGLVTEVVDAGWEKVAVIRCTLGVISARLDHDEPVQNSAKVKLRFSRILFFDTASGVRLKTC